MMTQNSIEHEGIVIQVTDTCIVVAIQNQSACAACHANGACGLSEVTQKNITVDKPDRLVSVGDHVIVTASMHNALLSVLVAYVAPSALILTLLPVLIFSGIDEVWTASLSLLAVAIYFLIVYLFRNRFAQRIKFKVKMP